MKKIYMYFSLAVYMFCCVEVSAINNREKLLLLFNELSADKINGKASNYSAHKDKHFIISKVLKKVPVGQGGCEICKTETSKLWYQHDIECQKSIIYKIGEGYYKELIKNFVADIAQLDSNIDYDFLIEIIPSFLLYFMHNASMFPPLGEGYVLIKEAAAPLSYFRDRPAGSPIMKIYSKILNDGIVDRIKQLYGVDKKSLLLQPLNLRMLEFLKSLTLKNKALSLGKIKSLNLDEDHLFFIDKETQQKKGWPDSFSLLVASGSPQNTFTAIKSGINIFLKYFNDNGLINLNGSVHVTDVIPNHSSLISEIGFSLFNKRADDLYDRTLIYRSKICDKVIKLIQRHKFKHIKPFHVKYSQNLMIEVLSPPNADKDGYKVNSFEHAGWVNIINGFFGGLLNHCANKKQIYIYTIIRDSYGFLRPTLTVCGTAIRLSMGLQPSFYDEIVADALIMLDNILDDFANVYIVNGAENKPRIKIKNSQEALVDINGIKTNIDAKGVVATMKNKKIINLSAFLLQRIKNGYPYKNNYYLNSMIDGVENDELMLSPDHIIASLLTSQYLLDDSKCKADADNRASHSYHLEAFLGYINEMILSRIEKTGNIIRLKKTKFLKKMESEPAYYLTGFGKGAAFKTATDQNTTITIVLHNIRGYIEGHVKKISKSDKLKNSPLKYSFHYILKEIVTDYKRIKYLLSQKQDYNSVHFYRKSIEVIDKVLEDLSILNTIYYYSDQRIKKSFKNGIIEDANNITKAKFLMDWGQQATLSSIFWLTITNNVREKYLYTNESSYYQAVLCKELLNMQTPNMQKLKEDYLMIYYLDLIPTLIFEETNNIFEIENSLTLVSNLLNFPVKKGAIIAIIIDTSSTPIILQKIVFKKWEQSQNPNVKYLIYVNSGNKNCQIGLDRYQFGQVNIYIKNSTVNLPIDFSLLSQISAISYNPLLNYLKMEMGKIFSQTIY
jgi:hypothetical protein